MSIVIDGLVKRFGAVTAVDGISFRAEPGQITGFLGANGAGKTTTMRVLATLFTPTAGRAEVAGHDVTTEPLAARRKLGLLTEEPGLFDRLTPRETLAFFAEVAGIARSRWLARLDELTGILELGDVLDRRCGDLSKGNRQKVALARALIHDPEVLLLDEPTATLDVVATEGVLDVLRAARGAGRTVLFSTHIVEEAERICDRIVVISRGRVVADAAPAELASGGDLRSALVGLMRGQR